jgi:hypothetical protein
VLAREGGHVRAQRAHGALSESGAQPPGLRIAKGVARPRLGATARKQQQILGLVPWFITWSSQTNGMRSTRNCGKSHYGGRLRVKALLSTVRRFRP